MCWVSSEELWRSRRVLSASAPTHDSLNQYFWKFYEGDRLQLWNGPSLFQIRNGGWCAVLQVNGIDWFSFGLKFPENLVLEIGVVIWKGKFLLQPLQPRKRVDHKLVEPSTKPFPVGLNWSIQIKWTEISRNFGSIDLALR